MIVAQCPNSECRRTLELEDASAGTRGTCPHCGRAFMVPNVIQGKDAPPAPAAKPPPLPGSRATQAPPQPTRSAAPPPAPSKPSGKPPTPETLAVPAPSSGVGAKIAVLLGDALVRVLDPTKLLFFVLAGVVASVVVSIWLGIALLVAVQGQNAAAAMGFVVIAV
ncbi:MAG: hypothetical protein JXO22_00810, partial [Phycisphaerae bacterium]|nr:hypothetical protein [Phycisphaerae bacterium]